MFKAASEIDRNQMKRYKKEVNLASYLVVEELKEIRFQLSEN